MHARWLSQFGIVLAVCLAVSARIVSADVVTLRGGGEVHGEFIGDDYTRTTADIQIRTLSGAIITVPSEEITAVARRPIVQEQYELRRRKAPDTLKGQWELAEWCTANGLRDRRQVHLQRMLKFDPEHAEARRLLGYRHVDGRWLTQDEIMAARGLVKFRGQYRRPQDIELLAQKNQDSEVEKSWYKKVRVWHGWTKDARRDRQSDGVDNLKSIRDPNAIAALTRTFAGDRNDESRLLYVKILTGINEDRSLRALVNLSLFDDSSDVRDAAMQGVKKLDAAKALPVYVQALQSDANVVVSRAALALSELSTREDFADVIPPLIAALVKVQKEKVQFVDAVYGMAVHNPIFPGGFWDTVGKVQHLIDAGVYPDGAWVQVAFPPGLGPHVKTTTVEKEYPNPHVRKALVKLTGEDYVHDVASWRVWWLSQEVKYAPQAATAKRAGQR